MCLALPGRVVSIVGADAEVVVRDTVRKAGGQLYPETRVGDYVLVKSGLVVEILPETEAKALIALLDEMLALLDGESDQVNGADEVDHVGGAMEAAREHP